MYINACIGLSTSTVTQKTIFIFIFVLKPDGRNEESSVMMDASTTRSGWVDGLFTRSRAF